MKKTLSLLLAILMLVSALPMVASAACAHDNTAFYPATKWVCDVPGYSNVKIAVNGLKVMSNT